jgi:competence protein ComEC
MALIHRGIAALLLWLIFATAIVVGQPIMHAHYINVGQGAATLLEFPCGAVLIDTGSQDDAHTDALIEYLTDFFGRRTDLNRTIATLFITHSHIDHTRGLRRVVETFNVQNYVDNGIVAGSGRGNPGWIRRAVEEGEITVRIRPVLDEEVIEEGGLNGLSDASIDPIECDDCDPRIRILSGGDEDYYDLNDISLVIRVDFGESSFLFTGDMETGAIDRMIQYYLSAIDILDVDVYQAGHHGSWNGTTLDLVQAMTPEIAVIPVGRWDFGREPRLPFSTYAYGHPRMDTIELLHGAIRRSRSVPLLAMVAVGARQFQPFSIERAIYANGWDGNVNIRATLDGTFRVDVSERPTPLDERIIAFRGVGPVMFNERGPVRDALPGRTPAIEEASQPEPETRPLAQESTTQAEPPSDLQQQKVAPPAPEPEAARARVVGGAASSIWLIVAIITGFTIALIFVTAWYMGRYGTPETMIAAFGLYIVITATTVLIILGFASELSNLADLIGAVLGFLLGWASRASVRTEPRPG